MTGNFLGIVENVTFAADVSKKEPKFGVLADLSKTELLVYQKRNFCIYQILDHLTLNDLVATENNWPRTKPTNFETVPSILRIEKVIWKTAR